jgi:hypothetical protein
VRRLSAAIVLATLAALWLIEAVPAARADTGGAACAGNACVVFDPPAGRAGQEITVRNVVPGRPVGVLDDCTSPGGFVFLDPASDYEAPAWRGTPTRPVFTVPALPPGDYEVTMFCDEPGIGQVLTPRFTILGLPETSIASVPADGPRAPDMRSAVLLTFPVALVVVLRRLRVGWSPA